MDQVLAGTQNSAPQERILLAYNGATSAEWGLSIRNPINAIRAKTAANEASFLAPKIASKLGAAGSSHNGPEDAIRHVLWNALMTQYIGPYMAKQFADAHESEAIWASEVAMDSWNNIVGRAIGAAHPDADAEELSLLVEVAYGQGQLRVLRHTGSGEVIPGTKIMPSGTSGNSQELPADPGIPNELADPDPTVPAQPPPGYWT